MLATTILSPHTTTGLAAGRRALAAATTTAPIRRSIGRASTALRAATENDSTAVSGEWPVTWSLASYEDVGAFFQANVFNDTAAPDTKLSLIMSTNLILATPDMALAEARGLFDEVRVCERVCDRRAASSLPASAAGD